MKVVNMSQEAVPAFAMTVSTATATWAWLATALPIVQGVAALVAVGVGVVTGLYYWEKYKEIKCEHSKPDSRRT